MLANQVRADGVCVLQPYPLSLAVTFPAPQSLDAFLSALQVGVR